jgi:magnesium-transporting ATPase (P-type)
MDGRDIPHPGRYHAGVATASETHPGLTTAEAAARAAARGPRAPETSSRSVRAIVRANLLTLVNLITLVFLILIAASGAWHDAVFAAIIVANIALGITQEVRAKRSLDRLALLVAPRADVRRDGASVPLPAEEVVPDDVVELQPGRQVIADGTLLEAATLAMDESVLTGESNAVPKAPGDRVLSGSYCAQGSGVYRVEAVGDDSFAARLTQEARAARRRLSPLQLEIDRLLRILVVAMVPMSVALGIALWQHDASFREAAQTATAGLISLVPEGLVLLASVTFAAGAVRMGRRGALVQQLNAVESLAGVDLVCLDKTGTLTDGTLELVATAPAAGVSEEELRTALARLATAASVRSPTVDALARELEADAPVDGVVADEELPFSSRWKWSGVRLGDEVLVLGAPEVLGAGSQAAEIERRQEARERVLVVGRATALPVAPSDDEAPEPPSFVPLGLVALRERMRPDARELVAYLRREGVELKVMSGDAPRTVEAVARAAGFVDPTTVAGPDLPADPAALAEVARRNAVFARVTPEQKRDLVGALVARGHHVAMVGDGVNDVPAMKAASLSVAVGTGAQIARGVADIVLVDDDFRALPAGIVEGRRILANIRRVAKLFVVKSAFAATLILTVGLAGVEYPLLPRHITFAALLTVGIPATTLALAPSTGRPPALSFLRDLARFSVPGGVVSALAVLAAYFGTRGLPGRTVEEARTVAVVVLVLTGLYLVSLLEDEAMQRSHVRSAGVVALMVTLLTLLVLAFAAAPVRDFFALQPLGGVEVVLSLLGATFAVGALGLLGFRAPLLARRLLRGLSARPAA